MALTDCLKCALVTYLFQTAMIFGLLWYNIASYSFARNPECPNRDLHTFVRGIIAGTAIYLFLMIFRLALLFKTVFSLDTPYLKRVPNIILTILESLLELFFLAWFIYGNIQFWGGSDNYTTVNNNNGNTVDNNGNLINNNGNLINNNNNIINNNNGNNSSVVNNGNANDCNYHNPVIYVCALVDLIFLYVWYPLLLIKYITFCYSCAKADNFAPSTNNALGRQAVNRQVV